MGPDIQSLQAIHLSSSMFAKFGPRRFDRPGVEYTNAVGYLAYEARDLENDVFGNFGVVTTTRPKLLCGMGRGGSEQPADPDIPGYG